MTLKLRMRRWRCCNKTCERQTFVERLPEIATPLRAPDAARRRTASSFWPQRWRPTRRTLDGAHWHADERRYDLAPSQASSKSAGRRAGVRVVGIDDWAWRKGSTYGTIVVDLERREVIDVLPDRSMAGTANWLKQHPEVEIMSYAGIWG